MIELKCLFFCCCAAAAAAAAAAKKEGAFLNSLYFVF